MDQRVLVFRMESIFPSRVSCRTYCVFEEMGKYYNMVDRKGSLGNPHDYYEHAMQLENDIITFVLEGLFCNLHTLGIASDAYYHHYNHYYVYYIYSVQAESILLFTKNEMKGSFVVLSIWFAFVLDEDSPSESPLIRYNKIKRYCNVTCWTEYNKCIWSLI